MGVARNIDERRRARKSLEESEERFRALVENGADVITLLRQLNAELNTTIRA